MTPASRHPLVLVVDDNRHDLAEMRDLLTRRGFRVETAINYASGVAQLGRFEFDVVVSDLRLSDNRLAADGVELLRAAKTAHPRAVRVLVTGYSDGPDLAKTADAVYADKFEARIMLVQIIKAALAERDGRP